MPEAHTTPWVLRRAAEYLETHGWHQGDFFKYRPRHESSSTDDILAGIGQPACLLGSLIAVTGRHRNSLVIQEAELALTDELMYMGAETGHIPYWNDRPERTMSEVIGVLVHAADRLDPQGALITEPKPVIDDDDEDDDDADVVANELVGVA